ncbi:hypothetical protein SteCoe_13344 [Stentor coeruleus]|uniref:Uncharacterized protein n=1 Tax=Stentor coeruleus TaxID=5963 RepID=A0A1R2C8S4_9CILI|nr:hypothetical protein SteCoe_13344 [Stentor coeruleus]
MAAQGASLQNYNNQLISCLEELKDHRTSLDTQIEKEMGEKSAIEREISELTARLSQINESLSKKLITKQEYDKAISETEGAYLKILESSQTLLHVLKRETVNLSRQ